MKMAAQLTITLQFQLSLFHTYIHTYTCRRCSHTWSQNTFKRKSLQLYTLNDLRCHTKERRLLTDWRSNDAVKKIQTKKFLDMLDASVCHVH